MPQPTANPPAILDCGGKRSATPLSPAQQPREAESEAAHLALYAHTEEDLRRERERSKDPAGGYGLEEIKPE